MGKNCDYHTPSGQNTLIWERWARGPEGLDSAQHLTGSLTDMHEDNRTSDENVNPDPQCTDWERPLSELFGVKMRFAPDDLAPPIDNDRLGKFIRGELSREDAEEVCHLVGSFRAWYDACTDLLRRASDA